MDFRDFLKESHFLRSSVTKLTRLQPRRWAKKPRRRAADSASAIPS